METPSPKSIMQPADNAKALHVEVSKHLNNAGFSATPKSLSPEDNSPLKAIEGVLGDTTHVVGNTLDELVGGASETARIRTSKGRVPVIINAFRKFKQAVLRKAA